MSKITKKRVVEAATQQSQNAQAVTAALRSHGWKTAWDPIQTDKGTIAASRLTTDEERKQRLVRAVNAARAVARDAEAVLSWVEAYAKQEGAIT
jgi:hypothetical protein